MKRTILIATMAALGLTMSAHAGNYDATIDQYGHYQGHDDDGNYFEGTIDRYGHDEGHDSNGNYWQGDIDGYRDDPQK